MTEEVVTTEKYDDVERIIAEAEEAAFQLADVPEKDTQDTQTTV